MLEITNYKLKIKFLELDYLIDMVLCLSFDLDSF